MTFDGKRVFVSGGAGVIGTALVQRLHSAGADVAVGDLKPRPLEWPSSIRYRQGDLNHVTKAELAEMAPEIIFHLAATFERSEESGEFWDENDHHNARLSHHLIDVLKDIPSFTRCVFASSYLIYDPSRYLSQAPLPAAVRLKETDAIRPRNLCGAVKLYHESELRFVEQFRRRQLSCVSARIFRSYGKGSRDVISRWVRALLNGDTLSVYRTDGRFDYVYADDVAEGLMRLASSAATGVVNLGTGRARQVADVLSVLRSHFPEMKTEQIPSTIPVEASEADMELFESITGWRPNRSIEQAIPEIIAFERARPAGQRSAEPSPTHVLITSVSAKISLVRVLRHASQKLRNPGRIVGGDCNPGCLARHFVDEFWEMPPLDGLSFDQFVSHCQEKHIRVIVPTRNGELSWFATHRQGFLDHGIRVMVSNAAAVAGTVDKLQFFQRLCAANLPVVPTAVEINPAWDGRFVVKERFGAGSQQLGLGLTAAAAEDHARNLAAPIFQPFITGREYTIDVYLDSNRRAKGAVARTRDVVVRGESQITATERHEELERVSARAAEALDLEGHVNLQALVDAEGGIHLLECNPRFGGASSLSVAAGLDSFYWFLLEAGGADISEYPFLRSRIEQRQIRYPADLVAPADAGQPR